MTSYLALAVPLGIQEIVLGLWLLAKGFKQTPALEPAPVDGSTHGAAVAAAG